MDCGSWQYHRELSNLVVNKLTMIPKCSITSWTNQFADLPMQHWWGYLGRLDLGIFSKQCYDWKGLPLWTLDTWNDPIQIQNQCTLKFFLIYNPYMKAWQKPFLWMRRIVRSHRSGVMMKILTGWLHRKTQAKRLKFGISPLALFSIFGASTAQLRVRSAHGNVSMLVIKRIFQKDFPSETSTFSVFAQSVSNISSWSNTCLLTWTDVFANELFMTGTWHRNLWIGSATGPCVRPADCYRTNSCVA